MSYLIALYVYYHGNNLSVFGVTKGIRDEDANNKGLKRPDEVDPNLVPPDLINAAKEMEEKEEATKQLTEWESMMRNAILQSQQQSFQMHQTGNIDNSIFANSTNSLVESYEDEGSIPMDFFTSINNF